MVETVICVCGVLLLGGITKFCCTDKRYSEEYYHYLGNNKKIRKPYLPAEIELYRYF